MENAVLNGALKSNSDGRIVLRSYERLDCFAIQIVDNGPGIGPDKMFTGKKQYKEIKLVTDTNNITLFYFILF